MKRANKFIAGVLFYAFVVIILLWTASLTLELVRLLKPGDEITPWFALALFDGGGLTWLYVWREKARGAAQRGIALLMLCADVLGIVIMAGGDLVMAGQSVMAVGEIGRYLLFALIVWTLLNVVAIYAYHVNEPEVLEEAENQDALDEITEKAREKNRKNIQRIVDTVADAQAYELTMKALAATFPVGTSRDVLEAYARPVAHQLPPVQRGGSAGVVPVPPDYTQRNEGSPLPQEKKRSRGFFGGAKFRRSPARAYGADVAGRGEVVTPKN